LTTTTLALPTGFSRRAKAADHEKARLIKANNAEIDRVREEVSEDGSLHIKTRNTLIKSIDSIRPSEEAS
jgi:hypothetical protein